LTVRVANGRAVSYSAAVVGVGGVGRRHLDAYDATGGIELVALADVDADLREERGEEHGVPVDRRYGNHGEMLAAEDLDAVSVATPSHLHHRHVRAIATADGGPRVIWEEKPVALSVADADDVVSICEDHDVEIVVNHSRRFSEAFTALREHLDGMLGDVRSVQSQSGRELVRNGTHTVDLLDYLLDGSPARVGGFLTGEHGMGEDVVEALGRYDDCGGAATVLFDDGTFAMVDQTTPRPLADHGVRLVGTDGKLHASLVGGPWQYWKLDDGEHVETTPPAPLESMWSTQGMFENAVAHQIDLLDGTATNRSPPAAAARTLEVLVAAFVSHYTGSFVDLPLAGPLREVTINSW
jgi:predicted dehydrogenase